MAKQGKPNSKSQGSVSSRSSRSSPSTSKRNRAERSASSQKKGPDTERSAQRTGSGVTETKPKNGEAKERSASGKKKQGQEVKEPSIQRKGSGAIEALESSSSVTEEEDRYDVEITSLGAPILLVGIPILITLILVCSLVWLACLSRQEDCYGGALQYITPSMGESADKSVFENAKNGFIVALVIISLVAVMTFVIALVFYFQLWWCMTGYVFIAMSLLFSIFSVYILDEIVVGLNLPFDWITTVFIMWNFSVSGMICFFILSSPKVMRQGYLIFMSCVISLNIIIILPPLASLFILMLLVLWDLFAVLAPCGPLRMIVEMIQEGDKKGDKNAMKLPEVMIYSTMVYNYAALMSTRTKSKSKSSKVKAEKSSSSKVAPKPPKQSTEDKDKEPSRRSTSSKTTKPKAKKKEFRPQLGLGDFIFYSLLVGKSCTMPVSVVTVFFVALTILIGLILTLILLVKFRAALPALPISLTLSLAVLGFAYFCTEPFGMALNKCMIYI